MRRLWPNTCGATNGLELLQRNEQQHGHPDRRSPVAEQGHENRRDAAEDRPT